MPGWLDTLHDFGDILATELGVREHLYRLKSAGLYRIVSDDRDVRVRALFMTVWRPSTRSAENSCGIRQG